VTDETPNTTAPEAQPGPTATEPAASRPGRALSSAETRPRRPDYRGEELDPERGPGLGCFWFQVIVLGFFIVLIPIGLELNWPFELLALLLFVVIGLLLLTGQSVIFLLRLVAADRRTQGRRRPLASPTKTVGELEDAHAVTEAVAADVADAVAARPAGAAGAGASGVDDSGDPELALADPSRDSASMIREAGVVETPATGADTLGLAAGPVADVDAAGIGAGDEAPGRTDAGDRTPAIEAAGGDEPAPAVRTHESSPESHEVGAPRTEDAGTDRDAVADTDPAPAAAPDDEGAPLPDLPPDEASPGEPGAGVRQ
jgi:hypothetical protein